MKLNVNRDQDAYRQLCQERSDQFLFSQAWWLDAVAGQGKWDAVIVRRGDEIVGALPFIIKRRFGIVAITQPELTPVLGPWVQPSKAKYAKALAYEKDVLQALARGLPAYNVYRQNWHPRRTNWLPWFWLKFNQTTRYTYVLSLKPEQKALWAGLQDNIRGDIKKAENRFGLVVRPAKSLGEFLALNKKTFARQGRALPYPQELLGRLDDATSQRNVRDILVAEDPDGKLHAGVYIVRDSDTAYYLMGGGDPQLRNSGATSLCMWHAIINQPEYIQQFDFEGSMIEPIERFFRGFGAEQVPYYSVTKATPRWVQWANYFRR